MASRRLDDLSPRFRPLAIELLARLTEARIQVMIIETLRSMKEHEANLIKGVSWTPHSKHIDGDAIDICPYSVYDLHGDDKLQWNSGDPIWTKIGEIGESLGLRWGGRWTQKDMGHFEFVTPAPGSVQRRV